MKCFRKAITGMEACVKLIIASNFEGLAEIVQNGKSEILVQPGRSELLASRNIKSAQQRKNDESDGCKREKRWYAKVFLGKNCRKYHKLYAILIQIANVRA